MAPKLSDEEIDDLLYFARAGEGVDLTELLTSISAREGVSAGEVLVLAKDEGKSTCLHMATGNGHLGRIFFFFLCYNLLNSFLEIWNGG